MSEKLGRVNHGVISMGVRCPVIREGDDIVKIVVDSVLEATTKYYSYPFHEQQYYDIDDKDVIGITESVVARATGNYVTVDEIADEIKSKYNNPKVIVVDKPIYSRNRFSVILRAIARAASDKVVVVMPKYDEVGNPRGTNTWTGVNIEKYYFDIIQSEGCVAEFVYPEGLSVVSESYVYPYDWVGTLIIYCGLHDSRAWRAAHYVYHNCTALDMICSHRCKYGLLGSNKVDDEKLKLFPNDEKSQQIVQAVKDSILEKTGKNVEVMVYGDGCFKDPVASIWEFADPVVSPAYTSGLEGSPNEVKLKALADSKFKDLNGDELTEAMKQEIQNKDKDLYATNTSLGTTPRRYVDLLGSLMDLTSGSGDKGTPVVLVKNYFKNYSTN